MNEKKLDIKPYIIGGLISILIEIVLFCLLVFAFHKSLMDGFAFGAIILLSLAGFIWASSEGFFDLAGYGFKQFGNMLFSKKPNQFNDYSGYKEYKRETRKNKAKIHISFAIVGVLFLIVAIILFIVSKL